MKKRPTQLAVSLVVLLVLAAGLWYFQGSDLPPEGAGDESRVSVAQTDVEYHFRSKKLFDSHYKKHGTEFGDITQQAYLQLANQVIASETALRKTEKEDGDAVIYEEKDNYFLILSQDGYIRTFFRPDGGLSYYERQ